MSKSKSMLYLIKDRVVKWIGLVLLINFLSVQQSFAQAPDCDQCDALIDDPIAYAECVEEFCNDAIPIDNHLWVLIFGGVVLGAYSFHKFSKLIPKVETQVE